MRRTLILFVLPLILGCQDLQDTPAIDVAAALDAAPPTAAAEIFAPGVVNRGLPCRDVAVSPDGDLIVWCELIGDFHHAVLTESRRVDGVWQRPRVVPFGGDPRFKDFEPAFSSDGTRLFFVTDRPADGGGEPMDENAIWVVDRTPDGWGTPERLPDHINDGDCYFPSPTADGTLYFTRNLPDRTSAIFRSRMVDGAYAEVELLPEQVNCGRTRFNATIDARERFIIVPALGLPDTRGSVDYYLVARNADDTWAEPVNMGDLVNSEAAREWSMSLSPDGTALYFMSNKPSDAPAPPLTRESMRDLHNSPGTGQTGIWWVDARRVEVLKPYLDGDA